MKLQIDHEPEPLHARDLEAAIELFHTAQAKRVKPVTVTRNRQGLAPFVDWWRQYGPPEYTLTPDRLADFVAWMRETPNGHGRPYADGTIHTTIRRIRQLFKWLHRTNKIPADISHWIEQVPLHREPKGTLGRADMIALFEAARAGANQIRDMAILAFLAETAARQSEVAAVQWLDVQIEERTAYLRPGTTKGGRPRLVVFGDTTGRLLVLWRFFGGAEAAGRIFALSTDGIREVLRRIGQRAGVKANAHRFRRTFATNWIRHYEGDGEQAILLLKIQMGHAHRSDVTAAHYLQIGAEEVRERYISPLAGLPLLTD